MAAGMIAKVHIGTSGWHYRHWVGPFYPPGTRTRDFLALYARHLCAVEINNSFYKLPKPETFAAWRAGSPPGFVFAVKAPRYITHMTKLSQPARDIAWSFPRFGMLAEKLGPILFQLPPRWRANAERLEAFLAALPPGHRYAFEFRDPSWFAPAILDLLARHNAALCLHHMHGFAAPIAVTADLVYVRLHGPEPGYRGSYDEASLAEWAARIHGWRVEGRTVHCYFDNDDSGFAVRDALRLCRMVGAPAPA